MESIWLDGVTPSLRCGSMQLPSFLRRPRNARASLASTSGMRPIAWKRSIVCLLYVAHNAAIEPLHARVAREFHALARGNSS
jgi:hypothetical protein